MIVRHCRARICRQVRDELEHLLDDDVDMAAMHLSEKLAYQAADANSSRSGVDNEPSEFEEVRDRSKQS